jgi:hypothetical protein
MADHAVLLLAYADAQAVHDSKAQETEKEKPSTGWGGWLKSIVKTAKGASTPTREEYEEAILNR